MQKLDWDLLRILLAVRRGGSFSAAARLIGVDDTTVARRVRALEERLGQPLVLRTGAAGQSLTEAARRLADRAERMEREVSALADPDRHDVIGTVRLTAVPVIANRLLIPALGDLVARHAGLTVELLADNRNLNLSRRDAELALRFARPARDVYGLWVRRAASLGYGFFAATGAGSDLPLLSYREELGDLAPARWIEDQLRKGLFRRAPLRVADAETALAAALAGLGTALLPAVVGRAVQGLSPVDGLPPPPERPLWLIGQVDQRGLPRIGAVIDWLDRLFVAGPSFRS